MNNEFMLLFTITFFSSLGYSLIAPLYPSLAKERNIGEEMCGFTLSSYSIASVLICPICPILIHRVGRKRIFYLSIIAEVKLNKYYLKGNMYNYVRIS
jgi:MFS family permease